MKHNFIGIKFERWVVVSEAGRDKSGNSRWLCRCDCGVQRIVKGSHLKNGNSRSCGCLHRQIVTERATTHGGSKMLEYNIWRAAKDRCTKPNNKSFHNYGGRGIKFLFDNFEEFIAHIGPKPGKEYSLDRINNEGHYEPGNVRWATMKIQSRNRRTNRHLSYQNETLCVKEWCEKLNLNKGTITSRLRYGWSVEKTLSTSIKTKALQA